MEAARELDIWMQRLRDSATAFVDADDQLKRHAKRVKPYRATIKENKNLVVELLTARKQAYCDVPSHEATLKLTTRKAKKAPSKDAIHERCKQWEVRGGRSDRSGDDLFAYLFKPDVVETTGLRRAKLAPPPPESDEDEDDLDQSEED